MQDYAWGSLYYNIRLMRRGGLLTMFRPEYLMAFASCEKGKVQSAGCLQADFLYNARLA